jgi:hypothetical protein
MTPESGTGTQPRSRMVLSNSLDPERDGVNGPS